MPEPLKNKFGPDVPAKIADMIRSVYKRFNSASFVKQALQDYEQLELLDRCKAIMCALQSHLPESYETAIGILLDSLPPVEEWTGDWGAGPKDENYNPMAPFIYMPHVLYVAEHGLNYFDASMHAQYELTQRFTAEFSIRHFIKRYPAKTLKQLKQWVKDDSVHVRRLVSEGTRPRLPWAQRLPEFQTDPSPVLELLQMLKDDPELYVRRSVANNLNDISKDNPRAVIQITREWSKHASKERQWVIRHGLRSLVKQGDSGALRILGYGKASKVGVDNIKITPKRIKPEAEVRIGFALTNHGSKSHNLLVDLRVHFVKANGSTSPKVFKLKTVTLAAGDSVTLSKAISFKTMTTRKHYPGIHKVDALINGQVHPLGEFRLTAS